jgi:hypothetical protein
MMLFLLVLVLLLVLECSSGSRRKGLSHATAVRKPLKRLDVLESHPHPAEAGC